MYVLSRLGKIALGVGVHRIGIIADDLTGAGDSAVQFAQNGWRTTLLLAGDLHTHAESGSEAFALVTNARAMSQSEARLSTASAIAKLEPMKVDRLFIKIDSTGRGSLAGQIAGALVRRPSSSRDPVAVVCPTYPLLGRTLESGHLLVHGRSAETTAVGHDPISPLTSGSITDLLPGSANVSIDRGSAPTLFRTISDQIDAGIRVISVNAASDDDLDVVAEVVDMLGPLAIPVGSAGLAASLARRWTDCEATTNTSALSSANHVVVVISSLHDVSRAQHRHLLDTMPADQIASYAPRLDDLISRVSTKAWIDANLSMKSTSTSVVVSPTARGTGADTPASIAAGLAMITQAIVSEERNSTLVLVGGEGARAVLLELGISAVTIIGSLQEGVPVGTVEGGPQSGVTVVTKAGGFGTPSTITRLLPRLLRETPRITLTEGTQS